MRTTKCGLDYFQFSSHAIMKTCCEKYMVEDYLTALYSEAKSIISQERQQDMANMYILLRSVSKNLIPYMAEFKDHIVDEGLHRLDEIKGDNVRFFTSTRVTRLVAY